MNWYDKVIGAVSPALLEKRLQAQANAFLLDKQLSRMQQRDEVYRTVYEAATTTRRGAGFKGANGQSPNKAIGKYAKSLRQRSRYMFANTPTTKRAVRSIANNVVGLGVTPTPKGDATLVGKLKELWEKWGETKACDWNGKGNFYHLQKLNCKTETLSGECFAIRKRVTSSVNELGLQIMLLEPDFLDELKNEDRTAGGGWIQNGIEYSGDGKVIKYWFFPVHPDIRQEESKPVDAKDVAHSFMMDRPGQNRGVSEGAATMMTERDLDDYLDAEIMGKKAGASFAGYITSPDPDGDAADETDEEGNQMIEPGTISKLRNGESITFSTPPVSGAMAPFVAMYKRDTAAGWGISYEMLTGDYSQVNFSSGRMGWIENQRNIEDRQWFVLIPDFCETVYSWFLEAAAVVMGKADLPKLVKVSWTTPRREMIDPVKEVNAIKEQLKARLISWEEVVRMQSYIPDDLFAELEADAKRFGIKDMTPDWAVPTTPPVVTPPPDDEETKKDK